MSVSIEELKEFLEAKYLQYNCAEFIENDPIQIPHLFHQKEDIEISGLLAATIAWGQRTTIVNNAKKMMQMMEGEPYQFVMNATKSDLRRLNAFVHRTFNGTDLCFFILSIKNIYQNHGGLESVFSAGKNALEHIENFRNVMLATPHEKRSEKHISSPEKGSAAKRLNMYLRWMVRQDGVDFGIWSKIEPKELMIPLDVHTGNVARNLGILKRKQNDWKALEELMSVLRKMDSHDPCKYDFALFGIGVNQDLALPN